MHALSSVRMTQPPHPPAPPPPPPAPSDWCLFLDVDGTLIELADSPFDAHVGDNLRSLLADVSRALGGALALVSGRSIEYMDALFAPLVLAAAGLHGVERRRADGARQGDDRNDPQLDAARTVATALVRSHPGTLLEDKGRTLALHFRMAPQFEAAVREAVAEIAADLGPGYHVQAGNMLVEIKPRGVDKGRAVRAFMQEAPFAGRLAVYVGDDLTDLDGFQAVDECGGLTVSVGSRIQGGYHLKDPAAVRAWLRGIADAGIPPA